MDTQTIELRYIYRMRFRAMYFLLMLSGFAGELALLTSHRCWPDMYRAPLLWFVFGSITLVGAWGCWVRKPDNRVSENQIQIIPLSNTWLLVLGCLIFGGCLLGIYKEVQHHIDLHPPNPLESDVIPTLKILVQRILRGEWVYAPIDFPGWTVHNGYLTFQYLPLLIPELLGMDYRWFTLGVFMITGIALLVYSSKNSLPEILAKSLIFLATLRLAVKYDASSLIYSIEWLDAAYYMFLAFSLFSRNTLIRSAGILFCLLSRYALVFWIPLYAIAYFFQAGRKKTLQVILLVITGIWLFYGWPFLTRQPDLFFEGLAYYKQTAIGQWTLIPEWYQYVGKPFHLCQGLSTSILFYDFGTGSVEQKLALAQTIHLLAILLAVVLLTVIYFLSRNQERWYLPGFLLWSLKAYLMIFYGFLYVPFAYLFWVPIACSLAMIFLYRFNSSTDSVR